MVLWTAKKGATMTRYAITSDVHRRLGRLQAILADARRRQVTAFVDLGDVGSDPCYDALRHAGAHAVFGNYETSQWGNLSAENQRWVHALKPMIVGKTFLAAHAAPYLPSSLSTVNDVWDYMTEHNVTWRKLFPRLDQDENARWLTYAELEQSDKRVFFHGHTHTQTVYRVGPTGSMTRLEGIQIALDRRARYIVGVGSVGQPVGATVPCYVIYDEDEQRIELHQAS
jgi:predicted phosphodiesterase